MPRYGRYPVSLGCVSKPIALVCLVPRTWVLKQGFEIPCKVSKPYLEFKSISRFVFAGLRFGAKPGFVLPKPAPNWFLLSPCTESLLACLLSPPWTQAPPLMPHTHITPRPTPAPWWPWGLEGTRLAHMVPINPKVHVISSHHPRATLRPRPPPAHGSPLCPCTPQRATKPWGKWAGRGAPTQPTVYAPRAPPPHPPHPSPSADPPMQPLHPWKGGGARGASPVPPHPHPTHLPPHISTSYLISIGTTSPRGRRRQKQTPRIKGCPTVPRLHLGFARVAAGELKLAKHISPKRARTVFTN